MRLLSRAARTAVVLGLGVGVLAARASAEPQKGTKQQALGAAAAVLKKAAPALARYEKLKADGKLDQKPGEGNLALRVCCDLRDAWGAGYDAYQEAVADGWSEHDPDLAKAAADLNAVRVQFEAAGMWVAVRLGEKPIEKYRDRLEVLRDAAFVAMSLVNANQADEGQERFRDVDLRLSNLTGELKAAEDDGQESELTLKHPAYARLVAEIARLKQGGQGALDTVNKGRDGISAEITALLTLVEKNRGLFAKADQLLGVVGSDAEVAEKLNTALAQFEAFDKDSRAAAERIQREFGQKYGTTSADIHNKLRELLGKDPDTTPSPEFAYNELCQGLDALNKARGGVAAKLFDEVRGTLDKIEELGEFNRVATYDTLRPKLALAAKLDPANAAIKARLDGLAAEQKATAEKLERTIDGRTWGPHKAGFAGPGTTDGLAKAALTWIRANATKPGWDALAVRVVGDWFVFEKDALGRPVSYGLPVEVAWVDKAAGRNVANVFELSMVTRVDKPAPPFDTTAQGGCWWIRPDRVPRMP